MILFIFSIVNDVIQKKKMRNGTETKAKTEKRYNIVDAIV